MEMNEYQKKAHETAQYPIDIDLWKTNNEGIPEIKEELPWIYPALGLAGESGELLNKLKKVIRDQNGIIGIDDLVYKITDTTIIDELGDILWYVAELSGILGISLDWVATKNINKLLNRAKNGTIKGSGDNR